MVYVGLVLTDFIFILYLVKMAIGLISSKDLAERGKARPKRRGLNEEGMAGAIADEEYRPGKAAAGQTLDEIKPIAVKMKEAKCPIYDDYISL